MHSISTYQYIVDCVCVSDRSLRDLPDSGQSVRHNVATERHTQTRTQTHTHIGTLKTGKLGGQTNLGFLFLI